MFKPIQLADSLRRYRLGSVLLGRGTCGIKIAADKARGRVVRAEDAFGVCKDLFV